MGSSYGSCEKNGVEPFEQGEEKERKEPEPDHLEFEPTVGSKEPELDEEPEEEEPDPVVGEEPELKEEEPEPDCSICLDGFRQNETNVPYIALKCGHMFHLSCISGYCGSRQGTIPCPMCQQDMTSVSKFIQSDFDPEPIASSLCVSGDLQTQNNRLRKNVVMLRKQVNDLQTQLRSSGR